MRDPQGLGQQQLRLGAEPAAPMAQIGALVRKGVLEELLAGEVLEIRVIDPTLPDLLIGQRKDLLEQQKPDHEPGGAGEQHFGTADQATAMLNKAVAAVNVDKAKAPARCAAARSMTRDPSRYSLSRTAAGGVFRSHARPVHDSALSK
jgi:hypothetical protein